MIVDRNDYIVNKCKGKRVFDIGCACHDLSEDQISRGIWLHENIKKVASYLKGIDVEYNEIRKLRSLGYNIDVCNAEYITEESKFDIVVLGGCIEHFKNLGNVLNSVKSLCYNKTEIIISTVNVWAIRYWMSALLGKEERTCRDDHYAWYSHYVLENLLKRMRFIVLEKHYYNFYPKKHPGIRPFFRRLQKRLMPFTCHGLIITFKYLKYGEQ